MCHPVPVLDQIASRGRPDRCPGVTRPWLAEDGALVRLRLVGGSLDAAALRALVDLAATYGDGDLHLTKRANLQLRGIPHVDGDVPAGFVDGVRAAGLLPSTAHDRVRNVMVSPLTGRLGGRVDLRAAAAELDRLLLDDPACAALAGRFLFVLDDGRGDLVARTADLAAVALDADTVQLRAGAEQWGPVVPVGETAAALHRLTRRFLDVRGSGPAAPWHVDELADALVEPGAGPLGRDPRSRVHADPPPYGWLRQDDGRALEHVAVEGGILTPDTAADVLARAGAQVVVTPWHGLLLPDLEPR